MSSCVLQSAESAAPSHLASNGVKQCVNNTLRKAVLLVLVHFNNLAPVCCHLGKVQAVAQVHKIENVLLETTAAEANRSAQEPGTNAGILPNSKRNLVNVGPSGFADG